MPFKCCGCFNKGTFSIKGTFDKQFYTNGDLANMSAEVVNNSGMDCKIGAASNMVLNMMTPQKVQ
jgi:hypothetical protein